ncbi:MAG: hypothetical protein ACJA1J_003531 [Sulfitobacter pontiacus]
MPGEKHSIHARHDLAFDEELAEGRMAFMRRLRCKVKMLAHRTSSQTDAFYRELDLETEVAQANMVTPEPIRRVLASMAVSGC